MNRLLHAGYLTTAFFTLTITGCIAEINTQYGNAEFSQDLAGVVLVYATNHSDHEGHNINCAYEYLLKLDDGRIVELLFNSKPDFVGGDRIELTGSWEDAGTVAVSSYDTKTVHSTERAREYHHKVAIILGPNFQPQKGIFDSLAQELGNEFKGSDTFEFIFFGPYLGDGSCTVWRNDLRQAWENDGNTPNDFAHIATIGCMEAKGSGAMPGKSLTISTATMNDKEIWKHEILHNLGIDHTQI